MVRACAQVEPTEFDDTIDAAIAGDHGFYYTEGEPRVVGRAMRWAQAHQLRRVDVLSTVDAPELARRAALIDGNHLDPQPTPVVGVWEVAGGDVRPADPGPIVPPPEIPAAHWALAALMSEAGALPVDDHGVLIAEVAGLEVARVVDGPDGPTIDVGVGQADRELNHMVHKGLDPVTDMRRVIAAVNQYRLRNSHHPLQRLARERWLRSMLLGDPGLIGAADLTPLVPLRPRGGLVAVVPCAAAGTSTDGRALVVITMVGVDLDVVTEAADYRWRHDPAAELLVVMPERDLALSTNGLDRLAAAGARALEGPWTRARP